MPLLTTRQVRYVLKPAVFSASLLPLAWLVLRALEVAGERLGPNPGEVIQDELGIWGLRFILITLAVTPLRHALGEPWPLRLRRMLGLFAFFYCALHFSAYLLFDQVLEVDAILEDIIERPFITVGFVALVAMVPLAVTSTNGWRRRLAADWNRLHRLVYLTAILACWHFYWQVKKDITEPLVYCLLLAALLGVRVWRARRRGSPSPGATAGSKIASR